MSKLVSLGLAILALTALIQSSTAQTTHVVGDELGWLVPPGGPIAYETWAAQQTFMVGDVLVFNFTTGEQDVARVTKEAFAACNSTNPISLQTTGPFNYTLVTAGEYYFIGTMDNGNRCALGQKLAINVTVPRDPVTYTVGDSLGWEVPPGGEIAYATWAYRKVFLVGDTLVFNFTNGTQDVAFVTKEAYKTCNTTAATTVLTTSPARMILTVVGENFFTSTDSRRCALGQKLAINVTSASPSPAGAPGSSSSPSPVAGGPAPPLSSSAPPRAVFGFSLITLFSTLFLAVFY
ncbi:hypothetical protein SAY86_032053 [Trapa natans]|uniref:Phytocyanin domain-containing protein n=1 Tax=Trapa natans TaxID=22666 RepID=A0AAN7LSV1_TRANT|nr:hypothetical protein SAY86_032053 [Trapa natans]